MHLAALLITFTTCLAQGPAPATQAPAAPSAKPVGKPMKGAAPDPSAHVLADPAGLDFGIVPPHTLLEGDFTLVNTGDRPLKVLQAVPSCQCTTVDIVGKQVPAKGTLAVPVTMKVSSTGLKVANVKVVLQDEPRPITLDLRAEVAYPVRVQVEIGRAHV